MLPKTYQCLQFLISGVLKLAINWVPLKEGRPQVTRLSLSSLPVNCTASLGQGRGWWFALFCFCLPFCLSSPFRGLHTAFCQSWMNILMWLSCPWVVVVVVLLYQCVVLNSIPSKKLVFSFCCFFFMWLCRNVAGDTRTAMEMAAWQ